MSLYMYILYLGIEMEFSVAGWDVKELVGRVLGLHP